MKIAIYDIIHLEQVLPLISISRYLNLHLILFISEKFEQEIGRHIDGDAGLIKVVYTVKGQGEWQYIESVKKILEENKVDLFLLNSTDGKHLVWYNLLRKSSFCKFVLNVHEVHNLFYSTCTLNLRSILRHYGKKFLLKRADAFIVNTEAMKIYMDQKKVTNMPIFWIPAVVFEEFDKLELKIQTLTIVIPGTIDPRRRDYLFILQVYSLLMEKFETPPRLIIAGAPYGDYGEMIIGNIEELNIHGGKIEYYRNEIPEELFSAILSAADILWSPLQVTTSIFDGISEIYGQTKNSGNTHDAVRFAKPMLIPQSLITSKEIETSVLRYSDIQSCMAIISELVLKNVKLTELKEMALENARGFTIEKVARKFKDMLDTVLN